MVADGRKLRCFRGVDTLTAFALHLELGGDWERFERANALSAWLGLVPSLHQSGEPPAKVRSRRPDRCSRADCWSSPLGTTGAGPTSARRFKTVKPDSPTMSYRSLTEHSNGYTGSIAGCESEVGYKRDRRRLRPRALVLPLGSSNRRLTPS